VSSPAPDPAPRLALWYTLAIGAAAAGPWYVLILTRRGWSEAAATSLAVVLPAGRLVSGPLWGMAADRFGSRPVLRLVGGGSAVAAVGLLLTDGPVASVAWLTALAVFRTPAFPIVDALAVERLGARYGAVRAWGSAAYLAAGAVHGLLDGAWPAIALLTSAVGTAGAAGAAELLPRAPARARSVGGGAWWRDRPLVWLVAVSTVHGVGLAVYDHLFALHVDALGLPGWAQSLALVCGVAAEIALFRTSPRWFPLASPWTWLAVSVATGVPRFWVSALVRDPVGLGLVQLLHGVHFGVFWLAATALFAHHAKPEWKSTVQALLPTAMFGLGPIAALLGSAALLRQRHETPALLFAAAGVGVVATALAVAARRDVSRRERR
jgi:PPP family 3-phenylpropionic acid transporter